ncbi:glycine zipper domain-containing protein [Halochromatium sp.]
MPKLALVLILTSPFALSACGTTTTERAASAGLFGAAAGAALGSLSADAGAGALIGAGVGALGGYLYDQHQKGNID